MAEPHDGGARVVSAQHVLQFEEVLGARRVVVRARHVNLGHDPLEEGIGHHEERRVVGLLVARPEAELHELLVERHALHDAALSRVRARLSREQHARQIERSPEQRRLHLLPAEAGREVQQGALGEQALLEVVPGGPAVERERLGERVEGRLGEHLLRHRVEGHRVPDSLQKQREPLVVAGHGRAVLERERRLLAGRRHGLHLRLVQAQPDLEPARAVRHEAGGEPVGHRLEQHVAPFRLGLEAFQLHLAHHLGHHMQRDARLAPLAVRLQVHGFSLLSVRGDRRSFRGGGLSARRRFGVSIGTV